MAERIARQKISEMVKDRMRWPNPNPEGELELAWDEYEEAYARYILCLPSLTGLSVMDEFMSAWDRLCDAVMSENHHE